MKAYEDLTPRGKLRRTRRIAQAALKDYGFTEAHLKFIVDTGNIVYRVKAMDPTPIDGNLYVDNCFSLRLWSGSLLCVMKGFQCRNQSARQMDACLWRFRFLGFLGREGAPSSDG
jgi:hypothetical protein